MALHEVTFTGTILVAVDDAADMTDDELRSTVSDILADAEVTFPLAGAYAAAFAIDEWVAAGPVRRNVNVVES